MNRVGLVVHPSRPLDVPLDALQDWAAAHGADVVQLDTGIDRRVAKLGDVSGCELVVALGGDGTTLAALHAAAPESKPVLGVACGSLGALTATGADEVPAALDRFAAGDWTPRDLPGLFAAPDGAEPLKALNDLVLMRGGAGQVVVEIEVDGETYIRYSGDGLIASTPLGSSAYTLAANGPYLAPGTLGLVLTPLAPHGGVVPPLVTSPGTAVRVRFDPGHYGARVEVDGRLKAEPAPETPVTFDLAFVPGYGRLVTLGAQETAIAGLRRRKLLVDCRGCSRATREQRRAVSARSRPRPRRRAGASRAPARP